jgi:hypothetical protein
VRRVFGEVFPWSTNGPGKGATDDGIAVIRRGLCEELDLVQNAHSVGDKTYSWNVWTKANGEPGHAHR